MRSTSAILLFLSSLAGAGAASGDAQRVLGSSQTPSKHAVDPSILAALEAHKDPVDAWISLHPEVAETLSQPRLLHVAGDKEAQWLTEGDKLRLRRKGRKFVDITDHHEFYAQQVGTMAGKARMYTICVPLYFCKI